MIRVKTSDRNSIELHTDPHQMKGFAKIVDIYGTHGLWPVMKTSDEVNTMYWAHASVGIFISEAYQSDQDMERFRNE